METSGTNVCSQCKCRSSKKWHTVPAMDGNPATTLCNDCSSSASDLAQLKSGEAVDNSTESVASEELKYEVEFFSHQEEESQSNPAIDMDIVADEPGQSTSTAPKKGGKKRKGKRGGFRGVQSQAAGVVGKGKSRRSIFKQVVYQAPTAFVTPATSTSCWYRGTHFQVGDIVAMTDITDGGNFYAQIRGFLEDQYCEKSAAVTWLIPTTETVFSEFNPDGTHNGYVAIEDFDPSTFILGPEEDIPRPLECMTFVSHCPSDYFKNSSSPYPTSSAQPDCGFIWTSFGHRIVAKSDLKEIVRPSLK